MKFVTVKEMGLVPVLLASLLLSGCSDSDPDAAPTTSTSGLREFSSVELCGGILGPDGSSSLRNVARIDKFVPEDDEDVEATPVRQATENFKRESFSDRKGKRLYLCVFHSGDSRVHVSYQIGARWVRMLPADYRRASKEDSSLFNLGDGGEKAAMPYVSTAESWAVLYFRCPVGIGDQDEVVMLLDMVADVPYPDQDGVREDQARVMNGTAFTLARHMGCAEASKLRETPGPLTPLPVVSATPTAD